MTLIALFEKQKFKIYWTCFSSWLLSTTETKLIKTWVGKSESDLKNTMAFTPEYFYPWLTSLFILYEDG